MALFSLFTKKKEDPYSKAYSSPTSTTDNFSSNYLNNYLSNLTANKGVTSPKLQTSNPLQTTQQVKSSLGVNTTPDNKIYGSSQTDPNYVNYNPVTTTKTTTPVSSTSALPSYLTGYESLAAQKEKLLADQKAANEDYLNKYYSAKSGSNQANIDALNRNLAANKESFQQSLAAEQARTNEKKQAAEDTWGEDQRALAQTRGESEARNRNKFAALNTVGSYGAGSYGQAQENVESDFNRSTQQGIKQKEQNLSDLDYALQQYELDAQSKLDDLELQVTQQINSITSDQTLSDIEKENAIKELGYNYQDAVLQVKEGLQGVYQQYYDKLASAESGLSFDDNGQPLNQASYEWMLTNPDEYKAAFNSTDNTSANKVRNIIEQLAGANTKGVTGLVRLGLSDDARSAAGLVKQLSSELQIEEAKRLKGQGSMSDSERAILANSISAMNPDSNGLPQVSDTRFKEILDQLYTQFGGSGSVKPDITGYES